MSNILWTQPDQTLALTSLFDGQDPNEYAKLLQERGDIPSDWTLAATEVEWKETGWRHESHRWDGKKIVIDLNAATEETKARLRLDRQPLLQALDIQFQRNLETGSDNSAIVAEKNRLRDITTFPAKMTLAKLKALTV